MVVVENTVSNVWGAGFQKSISVPTAPVLVGLTLTNGFWSMDVWGQPGPGYTMETSADLSDWSDLGSTSMLGMKFTWTDTNAPDAGPRFYRVRRQP
jgi:hypothetical protein